MEDCYTVDFTRNAGLLGRLEDFISSKVTTGQHSSGSHHPAPDTAMTPLLLSRSCPWTALWSTC